MSRIPPSTAQQTDALLRDVVRLFLQAQRDLTSCCSEAPARECEALRLLGSASGRLTVQEFAERMGLEKTWASRLVARMEKRGLVRRTVHPADGRSRLIALTARGRKEDAALEASLNTHAGNLIGCVPAAERANVERALGLLRDALATCLETGGSEGRLSC